MAGSGEAEKEPLPEEVRDLIAEAAAGPGGQRLADVVERLARELIGPDHPVARVCELIGRGAACMDHNPARLAGWVRNAVKYGALKVKAEEEGRPAPPVQPSKRDPGEFAAAAKNHLDAIHAAWAVRHGPDPVLVLRVSDDGGPAIEEHERSELAAILKARGYPMVPDEVAAGGGPDYPISVVVCIDEFVQVFHYQERPKPAPTASEEDRRAALNLETQRVADDHHEALDAAWAARRGADPVFVLRVGDDGQFAIKEHDRSELSVRLKAEGGGVISDLVAAGPDLDARITLVVFVVKGARVMHYR